MKVAQAENGQGRMMRAEWEVTPIGEAILLPDAEAEKWKPIDWQQWADHLTPAPGQKY